MTTKKKSRKCGACDGTGVVPTPLNLYGVSPCGACNGKGVIEIKSQAQ